MQAFRERMFLTPDEESVMIGEEICKMSGDVFERGVFIIPRGEYTQFRKVFIDYYNALLQKDFLEAKALYPEVKAAGPYFRGEEKHQARVDVIKSHCKKNCLKATDEMDVKFSRLYSMFFMEDESGGFTKLQSPKMNQIPFLPPTGDVVISFCGASISFRNSGNSVCWEVRGVESDCEVARSHPIAKEFFRRLNSMRWSGGSGGKIIRQSNVHETYGKLF